jgi:hypothetical protein
MKTKESGRYGGMVHFFFLFFLGIERISNSTKLEK